MIKYKLNTQIIKDYLKDNNLNQYKFCKICKTRKKELIQFFNNDFNLNLVPIIKISIVTKIKLSKLIIPNV